MWTTASRSVGRFISGCGRVVGWRGDDTDALNRLFDEIETLQKEQLKVEKKLGPNDYHATRNPFGRWFLKGDVPTYRLSTWHGGDTDEQRAPPLLPDEFHVTRNPYGR